MIPGSKYVYVPVPEELVPEVIRFAFERTSKPPREPAPELALTAGRTDAQVVTLPQGGEWTQERIRALRSSLSHLGISIGLDELARTAVETVEDEEVEYMPWEQLRDLCELTDNELRAQLGVVTRNSQTILQTREKYWPLDLKRVPHNKKGQRWRYRMHPQIARWWSEGGEE